MILTLASAFKFDKKDYYWIKRINGSWSHVTPFKCIMNPILRKIQFFTKRPYVIASLVLVNETTHPQFLQYRLTNKVY